MKYTVFYVENCITKIKVFDAREQALFFVGTFSTENLNNTDDNWVGAVLEGEPISVSSDIDCDYVA